MHSKGGDRFPLIMSARLPVALLPSEIFYVTAIGRRRRVVHRVT